MKKNSHLSIWIETDFLERLKKQADECGISFSELCRQKLRDSPRIDRMEFLIERFEKTLKASHNGGRSKPILLRDKFYKSA